jgi:hypothetical protein
MDESFYKILDKLIDGLPDNLKNTEEPIIIDLVLDSGVFNGSYIIGALYFLKEMEKRNFIKIERISGSSVGSIAGLLYLTDNLDLFYVLYEKVLKYFKKKYNLKIIKNIKKLFKGYIPDDVCNKVNNKLFIKYNNINYIDSSKFKSIFKNEDDIFNTIMRSSFFPILIDGNISNKDKYIDGLNPYIFESSPNKKILFLNLIGIDKCFNILNVKNEKSNFYRILYGLLDMHFFFIKDKSTFMCSYIDEWGFLNKTYFNIRIIFEKLLCFIIYLIVLIKKYMYCYFKNFIGCKKISKIFHNTFIKLLQNYF